MSFDWFNKLLFSLIHLPSCYQTVCYRTVCSLNQPITALVLITIESNHLRLLVSLLMQILSFFHNLAIVLFSKILIFRIDKDEHVYDYRLNWTPLSLITGTIIYSQLWFCCITALLVDDYKTDMWFIVQGACVLREKRIPQYTSLLCTLQFCTRNWKKTD